MNYYEKPTPHQEQANSEAMQHFGEHLNQFKATCDALRSIESNLSATANHALKSALLSPGRVIQTDDGTQWQHDVDLSNASSICHRRTAAGLEFAVIECLSLKSGEIKEVLKCGSNAREVLQAFTNNQRQVLQLWKDDVQAQVREYVAEKYPRQDLGLVVESFEIKMARAISETRAHVQSQSRGIRI
jgi:urease gamma subunit